MYPRPGCPVSRSFTSSRRTPRPWRLPPSWRRSSVSCAIRLRPRRRPRAPIRGSRRRCGRVSYDSPGLRRPGPDPAPQPSPRAVHSRWGSSNCQTGPMQEGIYGAYICDSVLGLAIAMLALALGAFPRPLSHGGAPAQRPSGRRDPVHGVSATTIRNRLSGTTSSGTGTSAASDNLSYNGGPLLQGVSPYLIFRDPSSELSAADKLCTSATSLTWPPAVARAATSSPSQAVHRHNRVCRLQSILDGRPRHGSKGAPLTRAVVDGSMSRRTQRSGTLVSRTVDYHLRSVALRASQAILTRVRRRR